MPNNRALPQNEVINAVLMERDFQDVKHGSIGDCPHEVGTWLLLIEDELREAKQALIKGGSGRDSWASEIIQVAALCVAAVEQHGMAEKEGRAI